MREVWLRPNRRALLFAQIPPLAVVAAGMVLAITTRGHWPAASVAGVVLAVLGLLASLGLLRLLFLPRLARQDGFLLVYLQRGGPIRVPLDVVEVFFAGQGPSQLPRRIGQPAEAESETSTVVVRLADGAPQWHQRQVLPSLGNWCGGYITICGTWCEPLGRDVYQRLNQRLVQAHREQRGQPPAQSPAPATSVVRNEGQV